MFRRLVYWLSIRLWRYGHVINELVSLPVVGPWLGERVFDSGNSQAILVPVNAPIRRGENTVLPYTLLQGLIDRSSYHVVLNHCMCREAEGCTAYPIELGCLFLGDGARDIDASLAHVVDRSGALAHVQRAMDLGLMPTYLHSSLDAFMLQIPFRRMLAICFCCECCCTIRKSMRLGHETYWDTVVRLPSLSVTVGAACTGCGVCIAGCPVGAITLCDDRAHIADSCKGCGRCAEICPEEAISLQIGANVDPVDALLAQLKERTEITDHSEGDAPGS